MTTAPKHIPAQVPSHLPTHLDWEGVSSAAWVVKCLVIPFRFLLKVATGTFGLRIPEEKMFFCTVETLK